MSRERRPFPLAAIVHHYLAKWAHDPYRPERLFQHPTAEPLQDRFKRVSRIYAGSRSADVARLVELLNAVLDNIERDIPLSDALATALGNLISDLAGHNRIVFELPQLSPPFLPSAERELTDILIDREYRLAHEDRIIQRFAYGAALIVAGIASQYLPRHADGTALAAVRVIDLVADPKDCLDTLFATFFNDLLPQDDPPAARAFEITADQLYRNLLAVSRLTPQEAHKVPHRLVFPSASDLDGMARIRAYLAHTPFIDFFAAEVPFAIPRRSLTEHGAIFAPTGYGKTQLLQHVITTLLSEPDPPGMFIIDSQGSMLKKIERLEVFATRLRDRLVVLDPPEPALNFFQFDGSNTEVMELANYLFAALDRQLTAKQSTIIPYLLKLLQHIPNATLDTLREIMDDKPKSFEASPYYEAILKLDQRSQDFFRHQFFGQELKATKQQVSNRLYTILGNEAFVRMFAAPENRFSAYDAMQQQKIVLVNTSQRVLGETASSIFGRFIIAQVLAAAYRRDPDADNPLALLVLDEAFEYFDEKTERILSQARKYGVGLLFATQYLEQMPPGVKAAVNATTAIKLAGPVSYNDAMMLAREMYTTGEFIRSMRAHERSHAEFACHVRNLTPRAVRLTIPYGTLERQTRMDDAMHDAFRKINRARYGATPVAKSPQHTEALGIKSDPPAPLSVEDDPARAVNK